VVVEAQTDASDDPYLALEVKEEDRGCHAEVTGQALVYQPSFVLVDGRL